MASSTKSIYLILYNGTFAALWLTLLVRTIAVDMLSSYDMTYDLVGDFAKWIQTAALLEVVHAAIGQANPS
jgi:very-long-chain (3R)-3-hydroxyacyl-CoA dehydratase